MCECRKKMDENLASRNAKLAISLQITPGMDLRRRLCVATEKIDTRKRKPVPIVVATYCPFCGEKDTGE